MESYKGRFEPTRFEDLTVTVDFHCHSACRFCIVQEGMNYFKGVPWELYTAAVDDNRASQRYRRVTFTGGEVTLESRLFDYVNYARESGSFEHIRLQTNGRLLANMEFAKKLVDSGIDEYFVSLHGHDAKTQDYISQREGSFDEAIAGLENLVSLGVCVMTNTVLTTLNQPHLADIVETVRRFAPTRMEWWNYLPMEDYTDERELLSPMDKLAPSLREALARARGYGIETAVKYVPRCLLGDDAASQDNTQPDVVIVEEFYDIYPKFACAYEAKCEYAESCLGLHHPYITKYGWEEQLLTPYPRTTEWDEPEYGLWVGSDRPGQADAVATDQPRWTALIDGVAERHGAQLSEVILQRRACVYRFEIGAGGRVDILLSARTQEHALARSASFNLHYRNLRGDLGDEAIREGLTALVKDVVNTVIERDPGGMRLDQRKGMVGPEAFRPRPKSKGPKAGVKSLRVLNAK
ncbi:Cyclic pyranopterin monophosphate synthase [Enhygromyxa salina]|uniref:Cyclic pyranopterin monophosphate synthase n=1 Tax=Enhygromyxa salina TaxID=215803 RepID=A0A2S9XXE7_9BACT|nr:radical SAM protein [Enhygromyxa salina]PRP97514.1 Cyclic pyranopterin monophosphate synthase [Enhygromyxa salina]